MCTTYRIIYSWIALVSAFSKTGCLASVRQRPTSVAPCVRETQQQIVLRWGDEDDSLQTMTRYSLNTKGEIFHYSGPIVDTIPETYLVHVELSEYCEMASSVNSSFLKTQALSVRGRRARYIEYINPHTDVFLRAMWNPDLSTFQSRDMRFEFEQLMEYIKKYRYL